MKEIKKMNEINKEIISNHVHVLEMIIDNPRILNNGCLIKLYKSTRKELYKRGVFK